MLNLPHETAAETIRLYPESAMTKLPERSNAIPLGFARLPAMIVTPTEACGAQR